MQAEAGRALQAVLAACCMGVLRVPAGSRSPEEVDTLADFMATMEVRTASVTVLGVQDRTRGGHEALR